MRHDDSRRCRERQMQRNHLKNRKQSLHAGIYMKHKSALTCFTLFIVALIILPGCSSGGKESKVETRIILPDSSGVSVFELLNAYHNVEYDETSAGIFIKSIDSIPNTRTSYWLYFVNDTAATVASDRLILQGGEKVEWRFMSGY